MSFEEHAYVSPRIINPGCVEMARRREEEINNSFNSFVQYWVELEDNCNKTFQSAKQFTELAQSSSVFDQDPLAILEMAEDGK